MCRACLKVKAGENYKNRDQFAECEAAPNGSRERGVQLDHATGQNGK